MANTTPSTNMNLPIPTVGVDPGPDWANNINASLTLIDGHTHAAGSGVQITPDGLNINADLSLQNNNLILIRAAKFTSQASPIPATGTDIECLYVSGVDLYYNDGSGNQVKMTAGGSVNAAAGSITGLTSPALALYSSGTFTWQSNSTNSTPANMDFASAILRNNISNSKGLTLAPPPAMGADYTITLPALPTSQKIMTLDNSGNMTAPYTVDNSTITISSNVIGVPASGITNTQLAVNSVGTANIVDDAIQTSKINALAVTTAKIADAAVTDVKLAANSVGTSNIINLSVTGAKIAIETVTGSNTNGVGNLAKHTVYGGQTGTGNIVLGTISGSDIASRTIAFSNINLNTINGGATVGTGEIGIQTVQGANGQTDGAHGNIKDGTISATNLSSNSVTTAKLVDGSVTYPKLAAANSGGNSPPESHSTNSSTYIKLMSSPSSGTGSMSSTSRPILVFLSGDSSGLSTIQGPVGGGADFQIYRSTGELIYQTQMSIGGQNIPPGAISCIDNVGPSPGNVSFGYDLYARVPSGGGTVTVQNCAFKAIAL